MTMDQKWDRLRELLHQMQCAVIAYSGGVDSSLLLKAAADVLGPNIVAVTADSETYPPAELDEAQQFARSLGVRHRILQTAELSSEDFAANSPERCYFCKKELYGKLKQIADSEGFPFILDGSNLDDLKDYRPGNRAAGEFGVRSPLREAGFTKDDVRSCARMLNLPVWDKPSLACLSSRIPYGTRITPELLRTIQAAEDHLRVLGLRQVRVRHHGDTARIEIEQDDFKQLLAEDRHRKVVAGLKTLGYVYVCLDLEGYRTGSMNEGMKRVRSAECGVRSEKE
ncbi:MAG: TIGR00268 family protein [Nitrospirae bacterium GWD2_57_9]|nr:MAG: TIGR00268 family protein [Nitrospirae bacterium GWD2_57_9]